MGVRKIHLRPNRLIEIGKTKTYCERVLHSPPRDTSGAVLTFGTMYHQLDVTVHATLVTCAKCLSRIGAPS